MGPATSCGKKLTKATNEIKSSEGFIFFVNINTITYCLKSIKTDTDRKNY